MCVRIGHLICFRFRFRFQFEFHFWPARAFALRRRFPFDWLAAGSWRKLKSLINEARASWSQDEAWRKASLDFLSPYLARIFSRASSREKRFESKFYSLAIHLAGVAILHIISVRGADLICSSLGRAVRVTNRNYWAGEQAVARVYVRRQPTRNGSRRSNLFALVVERGPKIPWKPEMETN